MRKNRNENKQLCIQEMIPWLTKFVEQFHPSCTWEPVEAVESESESEEGEINPGPGVGDIEEAKTAERERERELEREKEKWIRENRGEKALEGRSVGPSTKARVSEKFVDLKEMKSRSREASSEEEVDSSDSEGRNPGKKRKGKKERKRGAEKKKEVKKRRYRTRNALTSGSESE